MTRWARANNAHKAQPSDATPWQDLKGRKPEGKLKKNKSKEQGIHKEKSKNDSSISKRMLNNVSKRFSKGGKLHLNEDVKKTKNSGLNQKTETKKSRKISQQQNARVNKFQPKSPLKPKIQLAPEQEETIQDLEKKLKARGVTDQERIKIIRKQKTMMMRKMKRRIKTCFKCRQEGHLYSDCPLKTSDEGHGICFKCGSCEHKSSKCNKIIAPGESEYPYATCFVCGNQGHISSQCLENPSGIFPKGGTCYGCGSVNHMRKDCPQLRQEQKGIVDNSVVHRLDSSNIEGEDFEQSRKRVSRNSNKRIISFK